MNEIITSFAYPELPASVAAELQAITSRIKDRLVQQVTDIIETGRDLSDVKSKLEHGEFEPWLKLSFNMTMRTAQKYMRAAEWRTDKSELSSHLTPNTIYLLSAPSTPEGVHEKVVERIEEGLPADPEYVRHVVQEAKIREALDARERREKRRESLPAENKNRRESQRAKVRTERQHKKKEEMEKRRLAANFSGQAHALAFMLIDDPKLNKIPLAKLTEDKMYAAFREFSASYKMLRKAIIEARQLHSDINPVAGDDAS